MATQARSRRSTGKTTDDIPYGLARLQALVWANGGWVGVNIYTAVTLMNDLGDALDVQNIANGAPDLPNEAEVERVETFCIRVKPYYGDGLSRAARKRICAEDARKIVAAVDGRLEHIIRRGQSHFFSAWGVEAKAKVA